MTSNLDFYLKYLHEGKFSKFGKILKNRINRVIGSYEPLFKKGQRAVDQDAVDKIKLLHQRNHNLYMDDKINTSEYRRRTKRLRSLEKLRRM